MRRSSACSTPGSASGSMACGWMPCRICMSARARTAKTCRKPTPFSASCAGTWTPSSRAACSWPRPTNGRGTPVPYYGDEIGMGDNIYLGDRNGVRTPMQWNVDRNAGFSRANPQRLYLPVIIDPAYHFEAINVEVQQNNPYSLLWWMKHLIALRKRFRAFGRGSLEFLSPPN